jgi:glycosyltransferase involved in cell wall biosynthesis
VSSAEPANGRRVEFLANSLVVGGAERVVESLCHGLAAHGWQVGVGTLRELGPIGESLRDRGLDVSSSLAPRRRDPFQLWSIRRHLARVGADIVYLLDHSNALLYGRLAAASLGLPQLCAIHQTGRADGRPSLSSTDRRLMRLSRRVVAVSETHKDYLAQKEGVDPSKLVAIPNGVDVQAVDQRPSAEESRRIREELRLPPDAPLAGVVAALRPEKNHELLLRALSASSALGALHLVMVGDGPRRHDLQAMARALDLESRVHWLGRRSDVARILSILDLLVLPSHPRVETFPLCILEAMAARVAVVATDVGSIAEMFGPQGTGALVPPGDVEGMQQTLERVLGDRPATRRRCELAYERVRAHYTVEAMVERTHRLLDELVTGQD